MNTAPRYNSLQYYNSSQDYDDYQKLKWLIYDHNKKKYSKLKFSWNKSLILQHMKSKIPELKTSFIKNIQTINDIDNDLDTFVLKGSFGDSADNVYVFIKINEDQFLENNRKKIMNKKNIENIIKKTRKPFIESNRGFINLPYDIKVHIFFGKICFFYIYEKNIKQKARYNSNRKFINYNKIYNRNYFGEKFKENSKIINDVEKEALDYILEYSLKIFNNLKDLVYCSIDWLYDPISKTYSFCELTPTPFCLQRPVKSSFIKKYITCNKNNKSNSTKKNVKKKMVTVKDITNKKIINSNINVLDKNNVIEIIKE